MKTSLIAALLTSSVLLAACRVQDPNHPDYGAASAGGPAGTLREVAARPAPPAPISPPQASPVATPAPPPRPSRSGVEPAPRVIGEPDLTKVDASGQKR